MRVHLCLLQSQGASPPPPVATWCSNGHHPPQGELGHLGHMGQIANVQIVKGVLLSLWKSWQILGNHKIIIFNRFYQWPAGRVFQYWVRTGRVGVSKYTIGYFRVSFLLLGNSRYFGYVGYSWVYLGLPIYTKVFV